MTTTTKPVRRETLCSARERGKLRPIIVELNTTYAKIKLKGMRHSFTVTYDQLWTLGNKNAAEDKRRERAQAKAEKRRSAK